MLLNFGIKRPKTAKVKHFCNKSNILFYVNERKDTYSFCVVSDHTKWHCLNVKAFALNFIPHIHQYMLIIKMDNYGSKLLRSVITKNANFDTI